MAEYVIFADSSVDLPLEEINRYGLQIVNLHLFIGGNEENIDTLDSHTFYQRLRAGEVASTSAPSPEEYTEKMRPVLDAGKDILYLGFSEGLSCSYNNGKLAIEELAEQYPFLYAAVGYHPSDCADFNEEAVEELRNSLKKRATRNMRKATAPEGKKMGR